jgi:nucleoside-diphosphate-sugar epimerase
MSNTSPQIVLITGGTGFIGSRLALCCREQGLRVRALGQENTPAEAGNRRLLEEAGVEVILGSVTDRERLAETTRGVSTVFHLAAAQHEMNIPDERFWRVNVEGTRDLLEASEQAGVERFVHGSTIGVYGPLQGELSESSPCVPDNIYGKTKLEAEKVVRAQAGRLPAVIIRISETYGPGDRRLLKLFRAIQKGAFVLIGNGRNLHHPIYIGDLVQGLLLAARTPEAAGETFVLPGKDMVTSREMVATIAEILGRPGPRLRVPLGPVLAAAYLCEAALRPLGIQPPLHRRRMDFFRKSFTFSPDKAERLLGFCPQVSFRPGALKTAQWYQGMGYLSGA